MLDALKLASNAAIKTVVPLSAPRRRSRLRSVASNGLKLAFREFPVIETERLILRAMSVDDAEGLFRCYSDTSILQWWGQKPHVTLDETLDVIAAQQRAYARRAQIRWTVCRKEDGKIIGSAGYAKFWTQHRRAEITAEQARDASGRGYMVEAVRAIIRFGFETIGLHTIELGIDPDNLPSIRGARRLGFVQEGHLRENYYYDGKYYDTLLFTLVNPMRVAA